MTHATHYIMHRKAKIRCRAPLFLLFSLINVLVWDTSGVLRIGLICAFLHESAHAVTFRFLWGCWPDLCISPFGVCLALRGTQMSIQQELLLAAAGPLCNFLLCIGALCIMQFSGRYTYAGYWFASTNLLVGGANLLPLPGLDGSHILHCIKVNHFAS